jgi:hypothetical protein
MDDWLRGGSALEVAYVTYRGGADRTYRDENGGADERQPRSGRVGERGA